MIDGHDGRQHVELSVADQSGRAQKWVLTVAFVENLSACPPYKVIYKRAPDKGLWWFWHSEVWPRREVEVSYGAHLRQSFHDCVDSTKMGGIAHEFIIKQKPFSQRFNIILCSLSPPPARK